MFGQAGARHERRKNLAELDAELRDRLLRLDEPVDWSDWAAVTKRSERHRPARGRLLAVVGGGAAMVSLVAMVSLALMAQDAGLPRSENAAHPLALELTDVSGLVIYSNAKTARFLDNADGRGAGQALARTARGTQRAAAVVRSLSAGPFPVAASRIAATTSRSAGPQPGDQAFVSFDVLASTGAEPTSGAAVLTCRYGFAGIAYCDGAIDLADGTELTTSGTLESDTNHLTLMVTSSSIHELALRTRTA